MSDWNPPEAVSAEVARAAVRLKGSPELAARRCDVPAAPRPEACEGSGGSANVGRPPPTRVDKDWNVGSCARLDAAAEVDVCSRAARVDKVACVVDGKFKLVLRLRLKLAFMNEPDRRVKRRENRVVVAKALLDAAVPLLTNAKGRAGIKAPAQALATDVDGWATGEPIPFGDVATGKSSSKSAAVKGNRAGWAVRDVREVEVANGGT